ncbi:MAG TPA: acyltransferase [Pyrinomonadaceae bacterium]|nr:acyltransferase [Pyrinomonadaceae bacterium]
MNPTAIKSRLKSIDALRGMAALGVVLYHAVEQSAQVVPNNFFKYPVRLIQFGASFGYIGVFLFFVISGFCIHLQWAKSQSTGEVEPIRFGAFWKRRIRRLYPPYLFALLLYLLLTAASQGINFSHFFFYDFFMHLLMLHNLDPRTCYSINGVFWTLAIEEQLYLAYFLLLFIRSRWGWAVTLLVCLLARAGWMAFSHGVWVATGIGVPVPEAAASHWFTWALGAIGVEALFGLIQLPTWLRNLKLATVLIVGASAISQFLPAIPKELMWHNLGWFLIHPLWGLGFLIVVNRAVLAERQWTSHFKLPTLISMFATLGIFSYSLYLTHELTIMQSWRFTGYYWPHLLNVGLIVVPGTIFFAWVFFWFCEKPFMNRRTSRERPLPGPTEAVAQWSVIADPQADAVAD